jgi:dipeptidyl aminopeptidase/acylaminoacyl peptidase
VRDLTYDLDISFVSFKPTTDGKKVYLNTQSKGRVEVVSLNLENGVLETLLTGDRFIEEFDISDDGKSIFFKVTSPSIPSDIFFTNDYSKEKRITEINKDYLNTRKLSLPEEFLFRANDGTEIQGWLMKPHGFRKDRKYPLVVQIHGGPHIMWGNSFWHEFQSFTGAGYAVFFCNPRGSDGYGRTFRGAIKNRWGEEDMHDILTGVDKLVEQGFIDTNNLFLTGGSFGGFMTAWIVGHDDRFRAAVSQRGVYSLSTLYGCSDAYKLVEWEFDSFPWRDGAFLHERSPVAYIDRINTPLMILHSEQDYRAGIATADELFAGLRRLDKEAVMVRYPREGHELSRSGEPLHRVDRIKRMINWFETHKG